MQSFSADCHFRIFGFTPEFVSSSGLHKKHLEALAFLSAQNRPHLSLAKEDAGRIMPILDLLQHKSGLEKKSLYYDEAVLHAFSLFALEVAAVYSNQQHGYFSTLTRKEHLTYEFFKLLPLHVKQERSVTHYASLLHVTPKHLSKIIKEVTGKTCGEIIDEMVLLEARVLLDDPSLSVAQVAEQLCFSDQFVFSKFFKKHTGTSPSVYRTGI